MAPAFVKGRDGARPVPSWNTDSFNREHRREERGHPHTNDRTQSRGGVVKRILLDRAFLSYFLMGAQAGYRNAPVKTCVSKDLACVSKNWVGEHILPGCEQIGVRTVLSFRPRIPSAECVGKHGPNFCSHTVLTSVLPKKPRNNLLPPICRHPPKFLLTRFARRFARTPGEICSLFPQEYRQWKQVGLASGDSGNQAYDVCLLPQLRAPTSRVLLTRACILSAGAPRPLRSRDSCLSGRSCQTPPLWGGWELEVIEGFSFCGSICMATPKESRLAHGRHSHQFEIVTTSWCSAWVPYTVFLGGDDGVLSKRSVTIISRNGFLLVYYREKRSIA